MVQKIGNASASLPEHGKGAQHFSFRTTQIARPTELIELYGKAFTLPMLRQWLFYAAHSSRPQWVELRDCVIRVGRAVFVDVTRFDTWLNSGRGKFEKVPGRGRPRKKQQK